MIPMRKIEIGVTMLVFTMFLSCKSSINPTTTIGGDGDTVTTGTEETAQQSESTYDTGEQDGDTVTSGTEETARQSEATYGTGETDATTDSTMEPPAESERTEEMQYNGTTGSNSGSRDTEMNAASDTDYESMFSFLEMTDDQIQQFTSAMEAYSKDANMDASNRMDNTIEEKQDDVLSVILSQVQMEKYEAWKRDN